MTGQTTRRRVASTDGVLLEVMVEEPEESGQISGALLICHPHPTQGGTMRAPILGAIAKEALGRGLSVVRFNFRGVGESTGSHDDGIGEVSDVASVAAFAADEFGVVVGVTGWSFGGATALVWQAQTQSIIPYVGIAPPIRSPLSPHLPEPEQLAPARRAFIVGERDQFVDVDQLAVYAARIGAHIDIYKGSDHFFVFKHERLATDTVDHVLGTRDSAQAGHTPV